MTDHIHLADLLDRAHGLLVEIDRALHAEAFRSWDGDSPRKSLLAAQEQLGTTRGVLDRIAVAAGLSSPYIHRQLRPTSATKMAAAAAQREQIAQELAGQVERERRSAMYGRRGWAARGGA